ncbi:MAG: type II toxin-antitoxin system MqsR family toxin [Deltaproteobacteria bacterium]|nr:type II toxin-antitoxin system MqsR family toxin [Deltaproteobacteria bacterium]MBW1956074.1 type II toxin-antitoxin system MqsR family toxin [Deltaproteobacteria bacterium]MBW2131480.1 type II toxin-antitoxin system MqsR family toxin [Deltaproteobacteria bacterium]
MEKRRPHYPLETFKRLFFSERSRIITQTAREGAVTMGYMDDDDIMAVISRLGTKQFVKSMTTYKNHRIWQDVYQYEDENDNILYIKVQLSSDYKKAILVQMKKHEGSDE